MTSDNALENPMFKKLESSWNSHTPEYLHPYTKANLIWQLKITAVLFVGMAAYEAYNEHQEKKRLNRYASN